MTMLVYGTPVLTMLAYGTLVLITLVCGIRAAKVGGIDVKHGNTEEDVGCRTRYKHVIVAHNFTNDNNGGARSTIFGGGRARLVSPDDAISSSE